MSSSNQIPVGVGGGHCLQLVLVLPGSTLVLRFESIVGSAVGSAFGLSVGSIGSDVMVTQMKR